MARREVYEVLWSSASRWVGWASRCLHPSTYITRSSVRQILISSPHSSASLICHSLAQLSLFHSSTSYALFPSPLSPSHHHNAIHLDPPRSPPHWVCLRRAGCVLRCRARVAVVRRCCREEVPVWHLRQWKRYQRGRRRDRHLCRHQGSACEFGLPLSRSSFLACAIGPTSSSIASALPFRPVVFLFYHPRRSAFGFVACLLITPPRSELPSTAQT